MISEENKLKFITSKLILLPSGTVIRAKYERPILWEYGSILQFSDKLFSVQSCIVVEFGSGYELFMSSSYNREMNFSTHTDEIAFHSLDASNRDKVKEYCNWISSEEGIQFVRRVANIKVFL